MLWVLYSFVGAFVFALFIYYSTRRVHTGSVMFAYVLGPLLFGWYGLFLGPMILVFVTHFGLVVVPELLGRGDGDDVAATDATENARERVADAERREHHQADDATTSNDDPATSNGGEQPAEQTADLSDESAEDETD